MMVGANKREEIIMREREILHKILSLDFQRRRSLEKLSIMTRREKVFDKGIVREMRTKEAQVHFFVLPTVTKLGWQISRCSLSSFDWPSFLAEKKKILLLAHTHRSLWAEII